MRTICTILLLLLGCSAYAQLQPAMLSLKGIGGEGIEQVGTHTLRTDDNGFIIGIGTNAAAGTGNIGSYCSGGGYRDIFMKYNSDGTIVEWSKCYSYSGDSAFGGRFPNADGGCVLIGQFNSDNGYGFLISKHDASDNIVWQKNYSKGNASILNDMIATEDNGYILMGRSHYTDTNVLVHYGSWEEADLWVLKVDSNGDKVWSVVIGGSGEEEGYALAAAPGNGCYVIGSTSSNDHDCTGYKGGIGDAYAARLDKDGNILWHRDLGGSDYDGYDGYGVPDGSGGVLIAVATESGDGDVHHHIGGLDYWVIDLDKNGNIAWENCYGTAGGNEIPSAVCKAIDGSVWVNGLALQNNEDAYIAHADNGGNFLSSRFLGSTGQDRGQMIYPLNGGTVLAGGYYYTNDNSFSSLTNYGYIDAFLAVLAPWTTGVNNETANGHEISLYPNPATDHITLAAPGMVNTCSILIADITGRAVYKNSNANKELTIDISRWSRGMYYVEVLTANGYRQQQKILIN